MLLHPVLLLQPPHIPQHHCWLLTVIITTHPLTLRQNLNSRLNLNLKKNQQQQYLGSTHGTAESPLNSNVNGQQQLMTTNSSSEQSFVPPLMPSSSTNPSTKTSSVSTHNTNNANNNGNTHSILTGSVSQNQNSNRTAGNGNGNGGGSGSWLPKSISASVTQFIPRVASAPNAKQWFFSSSPTLSQMQGSSSMQNGFLSPGSVSNYQQQQLQQQWQLSMPAVLPMPSVQMNKRLDLLETLLSGKSVHNLWTNNNNQNIAHLINYHSNKIGARKDSSNHKHSRCLSSRALHRAPHNHTARQY